MAAPGILTALELIFRGQIDALGPWAAVFLAAVIFSESGLLFMAWLPGDSLLFAVGALTATGALPFWPLFALLVAAGTVGYWVNYLLGERFACAVERRGRVLIVKEKHLRDARAFCERFGVAGIAVARFVPFVRTFAPFVAGMGHMPKATYTLCSVLGCVAWVGGFMAAGSLLGNVPLIRDHLATIVLCVVVFAFVPPSLKALHSWNKRRRSGGAERKD